MAKTFWEITKESKIEIPEIQRDYAQGRVDDRVKSIRKGFVSSLLDAVSEGKELSLDFIFGQSVDRTNQANFNKDKQSLEQMLQVLAEFSTRTGVKFKSKVSPKPVASSNDKLLIPFDGQQRLTTLFLLHLFIGGMAKKDILYLSNFSYKTRESSTLFIEQLIANLFGVIDEVDLSNDSLSYTIKNQSWFFSSWEKDPTVSGMLVMLDEIKNQAGAKNLDYEKAWVNLTENNVISFDYFDIQEEGFDEDLYVKMNARGKGLTDFENFRAWLEKRYKGNIDLDTEWFKKIDKEWLDLFWKSKNKVEDVDGNFLAFFKNMALLVKMGSSQSGVLTSNSGINLINLLNPKVYTPTLDYEEHNVFNKDTLGFIFKTLDIIANDKENKINEVVASVWNNTFNGKSKDSFTKLLLTRFDNLNLYHKTFFFAVLKFIEIKEETSVNSYTEQDWNDFRNWLRVSRNLIYNSRIDDVTAYMPAILAISNFDRRKVLEINSTLGKISSEVEQTKWIDFFTKEQQKEECEKVIFIESGKDALKWKELISQAENHSYFYGQIDFIFKLSDNNILIFEEYLNKLILLFSSSNVSSDEYILQCLFFAFDKTDTWLKSESRNRFKFYKSSRGNSRERDENWRIVFNKKDKREVLKLLLDANSCELEDIQNLITLEKEKLGFDDWKYFILDDPKMLYHCGNALFTKTDTNNIRLLEKTLNSCKQRELRTFHYYRMMSNSEESNLLPFNYIWYFTGERGNLNPCFTYGEFNYKNDIYILDCFYYQGAFFLKLRRNAEGGICKEIESLLADNHSFILKENHLYLSGVPYNKLKNELNLIFDTLKKL